MPLSWLALFVPGTIHTAVVSFVLLPFFLIGAALRAHLLSAGFTPEPSAPLLGQEA